MIYTSSALILSLLCLCWNWSGGMWNVCTYCFLSNSLPIWNDQCFKGLLIYAVTSRIAFANFNMLSPRLFFAEGTLQVLLCRFTWWSVWSWPCHTSDWLVALQHQQAVRHCFQRNSTCRKQTNWHHQEWDRSFYSSREHQQMLSDLIPATRLQIKQWLCFWKSL